MVEKSDSVLVSSEGLELLTAAKARLGLSFAAIAERAGVSLGTVQRLFHPERGQGGRGRTCRQNYSGAESNAGTGGCTVRGRSRSGLCRSTAADSKGPREQRRYIKFIWARADQRAARIGPTRQSVSALPLPKSTDQRAVRIGPTRQSVRALPLPQSTDSVPSELGQLANLSRLYLFHNQLTQCAVRIGPTRQSVRALPLPESTDQVPSELGQLANLSELDLPHNQLTQVPSELGQLANLSELDLSHNQLTQCAVRIGPTRQSVRA
jgi:hypothetical protein